MIHKYYYEIEILIGPDAGQKVRAEMTHVQVGHPGSVGHTITVTAMKVASLNNAIFCNDPNDPDTLVYQNLFTPYDRNGVKIEIGDNIIWARSANGDGDVYTGTVVSFCKITDPNKENQFRKINVACNEYNGNIERINNTWEVIVGTIKIP